MIMKIGNREFLTEERTYIMGILNVTPDSFSDGGRHQNLDDVLFHAQQMIRDGADILDVGGESTRPGYTMISEEEEIDRVLPVLERLKENFDTPISVDTYKSQVAEAAAEAGADMINDIWGLKHDPKMAEVISRFQIPCCLMHNRREANYYNYMKDLLNDLRESVTIAQRAGIRKDKIILDPGVGFAKTYENNLEVIHKLDLVKNLGFPVLLGTSRKSVIGLTLDLPAEERVEGTIATSVIGVMKGASFLRVHDVKENRRAVLMTESILKEKRMV